MDSIGLSPQIKLPTVSAQSVPSAPAIPVSDTSVSLPKPAQNTQVIGTHAAEQARDAAVQRAAQQVANVYVLGNQTFSLFKDSTGQYITRFTNIQDGKVTYIPEPTLFELSGSRPDTSKPVVNITA